MSISERLRFVLEADVDDAIRGFEQVGKAAEEKLGRAETRIDKLGVGMTRAGAAMMAAGGLAAAGLVKAAQASGDLETELYKVDRIFGESAGTVREFAEGAADTMGMSTRAAAAMAVELGRIGQKAGVAEGDLAGFSSEWATIVGDAAAFSGADPSEVIGAIGAATRGEYDSLERFGGTLTAAKVEAYALANGLATSKDEMTDAARVTAALALIQEDLSFATGTLAERNADGALEAQKLSAQWENLQAQLGEQALPILRDVLGGVGGLLGGVNDLNDATGGLVGTVATWGTGLLLAGGAVSTVVGKVMEMRESLGNLTNRFGAVKVAAAGFGVAIAGLALQQFLSRMADANAEIKAQRDAFYDALAAGEDYVAFLRLGVNENDQLREIVQRTGISLGDLDKALRGTEEEYVAFRDRVLETIAAQERSGTVSDEVNQRLQQEVRMSREELDRLRDSHLYAAESIALTTDNMGELANSSIRARDRVAELGDVTDDTTDETEELTTAWQTLMGVLDQRQAADNAKQAIEEAFLAMFLGASDAKDQVYEAIEAVGLLDAVTGELANHPLAVDIRVLVEQGQLDEALRKVDQLRAAANIISGRSSPGTNYTPPPTGPPDFSNIDWSFLPAVNGGLATGGMARAGGTYLVGERGPELLTMGASSGFVTPNHALGGSNYSITVNAGIGADGALIGQQIVEEIKRFERRNGPGWRS